MYFQFTLLAIGGGGGQIQQVAEKIASGNRLFEDGKQLQIKLSDDLQGEAIYWCGSALCDSKNISDYWSSV